MSSKKRATKRLGTKLAFVQKHGNGFRGWYMENGRQRRGPTVATQEEAHRWAVEAREAASAERRHEITLGEAMDLVLREVSMMRRREGTRHWYEVQFKVLKRAWEESIPLAKLDRRQVEWFIERRTAKGVSASTIRHQLRALGRLFNLAVREGHLPADGNPVPRSRKPDIEHREPDRFTREEVEDILGKVRAAGREDDADLVQLLFTTGLRRTELAHVRVANVNIKGRELQVEHGKRRPRCLPIPDRMVPLLERCIARAKGEYLVVGETEALRVGTIARTFTRWRRKLKDKRLHTHTMRHAFGTYLGRRYFSEQVIASLMGHKLSVSSITQHYVGVHGPQVRAAMACFWDDGDEGTSVVA